MTVVPLYVDKLLRRVADPERDAILAKLNLSPGYVLFVGSLRKHKNCDGLLRAYAAMPESARNAHRLVLAGPAHRAGRQATDLARALGVENRLTVLGTVPDAEMAALYSGAALFAFPSFLEGFGLPPLEAMACGAPVVATHRTSVPEVLGDAALYVDPADIAGMAIALHRVLDEPATAADLVRRGHAQSAAYSPERTAEAMRSILADARTKQPSRKG
jgi:glycosyltransferase involved in cell wall biosynthesis